MHECAYSVRIVSNRNKSRNFSLIWVKALGNHFLEQAGLGFFRAAERLRHSES